MINYLPSLVIIICWSNHIHANQQDFKQMQQAASKQSGINSLWSKAFETADTQLTAQAGNIRIHAGTDKTTAYLRLKDRNLGNSLWKWNLAIEGTIDESEETKILGSFDGLSDSTKLSFDMQRVSIDDPNFPEDQKDVDALCQKFANIQPPLGCTAGDVDTYAQTLCNNLSWSKKRCDEGKKIWQEKYLNERQKIFDLDPVKAWVFGSTAKLGRESFSFKDATSLEDKSSQETPWSASLYLHRLIGAQSFGFGIEYQESYQAQAEKLLCPQLAMINDKSLCENARIGAPKKTKRELAFFQYRYLANSLNLAFAPKVTHDFESDETGIELPIYLIRNDKGLFSGGINIGWQSETDEVTAGIFVGVPVSFF